MKPRTVAIVQARMGSTRLPGKVMMTIGGEPLLFYLVRRLAQAQTLDKVVVATTTHFADRAIVEECIRRQIAYYRGSECDVLGRYVRAAAMSRADIIVRVTADNPFTDVESIDRVVETIVRDGLDYAIETGLPVGATGEALTWNALALIDGIAETSRLREHVTLYAKENPEMLNCAFLRPRPECARPDLSFTVDEMFEYAYARELAGRFDNSDFRLKDLIAVADECTVRSVVS